MIEFFLKETVPQYFGINPNDVIVPIIRKDAPFTEVDAKACDDASQKRYNKKDAFNKYESICLNCDYVVLKVDNNGQEIAVVNVEKYINSLPAKVNKGNKRCDLLMTNGMSHDKIVFCDLCCYDDKFIEPNDSALMPEGKRAFARQQMEQSLEFFLNVDVLNQHILTYPIKVCLFAYRSYNAVQQPVVPQRGNVETSMQTMITTVSSLSAQVITEDSVMNHNFTFVQNRYPNVYVW